jgi:hypothetical protein
VSAVWTELAADADHDHALAPAFGLGGREMTREVSARRHVEAGFQVGQELIASIVRVHG